MRFYQGLLPAIIWDKEIGGPIVEFSLGIFDTDDEKIIKLLIGKGYLVEEDLRVLEQGGTLPHGGFETVDKDDQLPSGRPPMDNPEIAGGHPHAKQDAAVGYTTLPNSEGEDLRNTQRVTKSGNIEHISTTDTEKEVKDREVGKRPRKTDDQAVVETPKKKLVRKSSGKK